MKKIYLDHSATTPVKSEVIDLVVEMLKEDYGNPSSLHRLGVAAEKKIKKSRQQIAQLLGVKASELIFTSGGTEANNLAIRGSAHQYVKRGRHLITTQIEHPSVLNTFKRLETEGFKVTYLPTDQEGFVSSRDLQAALSPETILVSIMHVNNEVGSVQPIQEMGRLIKEYDRRILFHVDAVQSFGRLELAPNRMHIDLLTISGHKIHAPKGIGALYVHDKIKLQPLIEGGGQERDIRSGTENVPGMVALGLAAELIFQRRQEKLERLQELKGWFLREIRNRIPDVKINGPEEICDIQMGKSAPYIINLSFPGLKGEVLLHALENHQIYVSTGSACHSRHQGPSHVLQAMGLTERELESAVRISLAFQTSKEELTKVLEVLPSLVQEYRILMKR